MQMADTSDLHLQCQHLQAMFEATGKVNAYSAGSCGHSYMMLSGVLEKLLLVVEHLKLHFSELLQSTEGSHTMASKIETELSHLRCSMAMFAAHLNIHVTSHRRSMPNLQQFEASMSTIHLQSSDLPSLMMLPETESNQKIPEQASTYLWAILLNVSCCILHLVCHVLHTLS